MQEGKKSGVNGFIVLGVALTVVSLFAYMWGTNYTNNLQNMAYAGLSSLVGQQDSTFSLAKMAVSLSPLGFIAGIALCVLGFVRR